MRYNTTVEFIDIHELTLYKFQIAL